MKIIANKVSTNFIIKKIIKILKMLKKQEGKFKKKLGNHSFNIKQKLDFFFLNVRILKGIL